MTGAGIWYFIGDGARARIFEAAAPGGKLALVEEVSDETARLRDRELGRDRPVRGRTIGTGAPYAIDRASKHDQAEDAFIRACAAKLDAAAARDAFGKLILVAAPRALGVLRKALAPATAGLVAGTIDRDLTKTPDGDLRALMEKHLGRI